MEPPTLDLVAEGLLSKWGFNDGDIPERVLDYCDVVGLDYNDPKLADWHDVLRQLVREHLLPALAANGHKVKVYDIQTIHNPIRAETVDGIEIDDYAIEPQVELKPKFVTVQWPDIASAWGIG